MLGTDFFFHNIAVVLFCFVYRTQSRAVTDRLCTAHRSRAEETIWATQKRIYTLVILFSQKLNVRSQDQGHRAFRPFQPTTTRSDCYTSTTPANTWRDTRTDLPLATNSIQHALHMYEIWSWISSINYLQGIKLFLKTGIYTPNTK